MCKRVGMPGAGLGMASALWVPNVEFIFGLTGATASVTIAYILPAVTYLRLQPPVDIRSSEPITGAYYGEPRLNWVQGCRGLCGTVTVSMLTLDWASSAHCMPAWFKGTIVCSRYLAVGSPSALHTRVVQ
jgi:hypothetical protein